MASLVGTGRRVSAAALFALLSSASGCQLVFGLDDYGPRPAGQGGASSSASSTGEGGGPGGATASVSASASTSSGGGAGGSGGATSCAPLAAEKVTLGAPGICGVRRLKAFSDPVARELAPGAYCQGQACFVYFERRVTGQPDALMCGYCADLGAESCGAPSTIATSVNNPYLRILPTPEIWAVQSNHIVHGLVNSMGSCTLGALTPIAGAAVTGGEVYPAISPNGRVLLFTRNDPVAKTERIWIAKRTTDTGPFDTATILPGLRVGVAENVHDLRAQPVWLDGAEAFDTVYFSSTRYSTDPTVIDELDVTVAHRAAAMPFDAPFTDITIVPQLSGPYADFAPVPLAGASWLWSAGLLANTPDADIFLIDRGCEPRFTPPSSTAFAKVNSAGNDEGGPAITDTELWFSRAAPNGYSGLYRSSEVGGVYATATPVSGLKTPMMTSDREPFPLADGRLLFVSDRSGVSKIWLADPIAGTVVRATAEPGAVTEGTPFVDAQSTLWLAWGGGDAAGVLAVAAPSGATWGKAVEVAGLGHVAGARDEAPRLLPDGLTLVFASTRAGGFFPGVSTIWAATRPTAASPSWTAFPLPELGGVSGVSGPSIAEDGCSIAVAATSRATSFRRDVAGSSRISP
ncbi:MAG: hypothetical protein ABJE95_14755 [Byssovorax sp.]